MFKGKFSTLFLLLILSFSISAQDVFIKALKSFKTGAYQETIQELNKIKGNKKVRSTRDYLKGISYARLQQFDQAITYLESADRLGNDSNDLHYELGQAYYAASELSKAIKAFIKSAEKNYKVSTSYYYVAYIAQILEKYKTAKNYYIKTINAEKKDIKLKQVSTYQLGEVFLAMAEQRDDPKRIVVKYVLPQYKKAIKLNKKNVGLVGDIQDKIKEVERRFGLDPNQMANGRILPKKRFSGGFSQEFRYDNNITLANDLPSTQAAKKDSYIYESEISGRYQWNPNNRFIITPNFRFQNLEHSNQDAPEVYQNDSHTITTGLDTSYETTAFNNKSSIYLNYEYKYIGRDRLQQKQRIFFARSHQITLGQRFSFFKYGPTNVRLKYRDYNAFAYANNNNTKTFSFDQLFILPNKTIVIFFHQSDFIRIYDDNNSTNNFLFRADWVIPEVWKNYNFQVGPSISFLDTKLQSATRGTEKLFSTELKITKKVTKNFNVALYHIFSKNTSLDQTFEYTKNVTSLELKVNF